ncbi:helix-turn-helix domain-containing protein [Profundibacter sp.]
MKTFKHALLACGLTQPEAAEYLGVSLGTVKKWGQGKASPPQGVWEMLADLFQRVQDAADGAADKMALDGIDQRAWSNIDADLGDDPLPGHAGSAAGAMALLMAVVDHR